jgi:hypothetical protein
MIWFGMNWFDMKWYEMTWYNTIWYYYEMKSFDLWYERNEIVWNKSDSMFRILK